MAAERVCTSKQAVARLPNGSLSTGSASQIGRAESQRRVPLTTASDAGLQRRAARSRRAVERCAACGCAQAIKRCSTARNCWICFSCCSMRAACAAAAAALAAASAAARAAGSDVPTSSLLQNRVVRAGQLASRPQHVSVRAAVLPARQHACARAAALQHACRPGVTSGPWAISPLSCRRK